MYTREWLKIVKEVKKLKKRYANNLILLIIALIWGAAFVAQSAGYLLSKKYHVDGYDTSFASECLNYFNDIDSFEVKKELEKIKSVSSQISERLEHGLYALQQNRQPKQTERSNYER